MIDIHCHILPEFDDGASNLEESLEMARMAFHSGVTDIVATPHFRGEMEFLEQTDIITQRFRELQDALQRWQIPIRLHRGAEVLCLPQTEELAAAGKLPTLGNTKYVLTEFYFDEPFAYMDEALSRMAEFGYHPVVAHPERYGAIHRDPTRARHWAQQGYVLQLNKGSVFGSFGSRAEQTANDLLAMGVAHLFASDAHSSHSRTPHVGRLRNWIDEFCDPDYAHILLKENPGRVLEGKGMSGWD